MELGKRIRLRREALGISQEMLAKKMGYKSRSSINKIELGLNDISQSKIIDFAKVLDTTPAYLMGWEDESVEKKETPSLRPVESLTVAEKKLLSCYKQLSHIGQMKVLDFCDDLISSGKYSAVGREQGYKIAALGGTETQGDDQPPIEEIIIT